MSTKQDSLDQARPTFLNVKEVAELLRIKTRTVQQSMKWSAFRIIQIDGSPPRRAGAKQ